MVANIHKFIARYYVFYVLYVMYKEDRVFNEN